MRKKLSVFLTFIIIAMILCGCEISVPEELEKQVTDIASSCGLKNVSVSVEYNKKRETYDYIVSCDGFGELSYDEMFKIDDNFPLITVDEVKYFPGGFSSDGDKYRVYSSGRSVYKNDKNIYDDFWNSDEYKLVQPLLDEDEKRESGKNVVLDDAEAFTIATYVVKENLKSPSTAKFCKVYEATVTRLSNGDYQVKGWVDAQNSFGAMLRQNFTVTFTPVKEGNDIGCEHGKCVFSD